MESMYSGMEYYSDRLYGMTEEELVCIVVFVWFMLSILVHVFKSLFKTESDDNSLSNPSLNDAKSQADINYKKNLLKKMMFEEESSGVFAVECPKCGAPLNAIYEKCQFCDSSYTSVKELFSRSKLQDNEKTKEKIEQHLQTMSLKEQQEQFDLLKIKRKKKSNGRVLVCENCGAELKESYEKCKCCGVRMRNKKDNSIPGI